MKLNDKVYEVLKWLSCIALGPLRLPGRDRGLIRKGGVTWTT